MNPATVNDKLKQESKLFSSIYRFFAKSQMLDYNQQRIFHSTFEKCILMKYRLFSTADFTASVILFHTTKFLKNLV